jgi:hypothetical protein
VTFDCTPDPSDKLVICTSTTRPAAPYEGQTIFETNTDRYYGWDGSQWRFVASLTQEEMEHSTFTPAANRDVTGAIQNWTTETGAALCPPWASRARVTTHVGGWYDAVPATSGFFMSTRFGGVDGMEIGCSTNANYGGRLSTSWSDMFTGITPGAVIIQPRARRSSGTGTLRADTSTKFSYTIDWLV